MITLTEHAAEKIKEFAKIENFENKPLRLSVGGGGCSGLNYSLFFDETKNILETDKKFEQFDIILVVDQYSYHYLIDTEIDYVDTVMGTGFKFNNPNMSTGCGGCQGSKCY